MWPEKCLVYKTRDGVEVYVCGGIKSPHDFRVQYHEPGKKVRTPKHIHLIVDLYMKSTGNKSLTMELVDHVIEKIIGRVAPSTSSPPALQVYAPNDVERFAELERYGEYSVEFLLTVIELIMIQEKTNYPAGNLNLKLFQLFRREADIFAVVNAATFRGA